MCLKTVLYTKLFGKLVGSDRFGNCYYESRHKRWFSKKNRWVLYEKRNQLVANIDTIWYKWLHYMIDEPPMKLKKSYDWIIDSEVTNYHTKNLSCPGKVFDGNYYTWNNKKTR